MLGIVALLLCVLLGVIIYQYIQKNQMPSGTESPTTPVYEFFLKGNDKVLVTAKDNYSYALYVDEEDNVIDLNALSDSEESFTVVSPEGELMTDNVITVTKSGTGYTVYYGGEKDLYRVYVYFNRYHTVTFEGLDLVLKVADGEKITAPETPPTKTGYTFTSWGFDFAKAIIADVRVAANWKANTYTVTFDANGGTVTPQTMTVTYGESVSLPVPQREGYVFTGWRDTVVVSSGIWTIDGDVTLYAMWNR